VALPSLFAFGSPGKDPHPFRLTAAGKYLSHVCVSLRRHRREPRAKVSHVVSQYSPTLNPIISGERALRDKEMSPLPLPAVAPSAS
jgi:hypothetical protein